MSKRDAYYVVLITLAVTAGVFLAQHLYDFSLALLYEWRLRD